MYQLIAILIAITFFVLCGLAAVTVFGTAFAMEFKEWWVRHMHSHHGLLPH